jgi:protein-disulfide isomerase
VLEKYPGKVKELFKNFPLRNHRMSQPAAMAAMAAEKQGKFWEYHDMVYKNFRKLTDDLLVQIARDIGLDMERFEKDRKSAETSNIINRDIQEAYRIGVRGTPTIFINGKPLRQRSMEAFSKAIENELNSVQLP